MASDEFTDSPNICFTISVSHILRGPVHNGAQWPVAKDKWPLLAIIQYIHNGSGDVMDHL